MRHINYHFHKGMDKDQSLLYHQDMKQSFLQLDWKLLLLEHCYLLSLQLEDLGYCLFLLLLQCKAKHFRHFHKNKQMLNLKCLELQLPNQNHHLLNILRVFRQLYRKLFFYQNKMINRLKIKLYHLILHKQLLRQNLLLHHQLLFLKKLSFLLFEYQLKLQLHLY